MQRLGLGAAFAACVPALWLTLGGGHLTPPVEALWFGFSIFGAAFILSWAAEAAQMDISQALATAILALICVLPEYAVDMYFSYHAAFDPQYAQYAAANMTGANRLVIGLAWPGVFLMYFLRSRGKPITLEPGRRNEVVFLWLATLYSFVPPLFHKSLSLMDTAVFLLIFAGYAWRVSQAQSHEPELVGPARLVGSLPQARRRLATLGMFLVAGLVIFLSAQRFAEALVHTGRQWGINEFLLVQWFAPLASEAPEFIVAFLWASRGDAAAGLGALVSSAVNQWTLLVGMIPLAYSMGLRHAGALPLDTRQQHEIILTACQSLCAVAILINLRMSWKGAVVLFGLFATQLFFEQIRLQVAAVYVVLAIGILIRERRHLGPAFRGVLGRASAS